MRIAKFWARDNWQGAIARGWSDESFKDARRMARDHARRVAERIASGGPARQYQYGERPLPEPVLMEMEGAAVTRNAYGARVLNTTGLMFVDVDGGEDGPAPGLLTGLRSLFGKPAASLLDKIREACRQCGQAVRIYQTRGGYRLILPGRAFEAGGTESEALMRRFGADPLYRQLCRLQQCFRARLTPKPWRCGLAQPPVSYPFATPGEEVRFRQWLDRYEAKCSGHAACRFLESSGGPASSALVRLVEYHDRETKAATSLPLA